MELFIATLFYCTTSICTPEQVNVIVNSVLLQSEAQCEANIITKGLPYLEANGVTFISAKCTPVTLTEGS